MGDGQLALLSILLGREASGIGRIKTGSWPLRFGVGRAQFVL